MRDEGNSFPSGGFHETNRTPSNRVNPACVPIQRYPSVVWAIAFGVPAKTPSSMRHAVCPYCEIWLFVSSAATGWQTNKKMRQNRSILGMSSFAISEERPCSHLTPVLRENSSVLRFFRSKLRMVKDTQLWRYQAKTQHYHVESMTE
jgi:hypothetical protein